MTPLLQQARGALMGAHNILTLKASEIWGGTGAAGEESVRAGVAFLDRMAAALAAIDAYAALIPYDKAIEALAPYLEDGWYAQEYDGSIWWHFNKPEVVNRMSFERPKDEWLAEGQTELVEHIKFPRKDEWRDARFQIKAGRVVPQEEGGN